MNLRLKITLGLVVLLAVGGLLFFSSGGNSLQKAVEETRQSLRQEGFKTDLADFNFSTSSEMQKRERALMDSVISGAAERSSRHDYILQSAPDLMTFIGTNSAVVIWKENVLGTGPQAAWEKNGPTDGWLTWGEIFRENKSATDTACEVLLSGPIAFNLEASHGNEMLLRHVAVIKKLTVALGKRAVFELHNGNNTAAWTNVLAATRLISGWTPEPVEISHLVRSSCATLAHQTCWQALQAEGWTDGQLKTLQSEWESVDFLKDLPETIAFTRASAVDSCQKERQMSGFAGLPFSQPQYLWAELKDRWTRAKYRNRGSYEDEKDILLFYRDREVELRKAIKSPNWLEMQQLPGATDTTPFQSKHNSRMQVLMNLKRIGSTFARNGRSPVPRAVEAESRKRILITAIALERFRMQNGHYPKSLNELVPHFLPTAPLDFINGQPLRYDLSHDGHIFLYSLGLDGMDDGGIAPRGRRREDSPAAMPESDLIWPRPASAAEILSQQESDKRKQEEHAHRQEEAYERARPERVRQAQAQEMERQLITDKLLAMKTVPGQKEPSYKGRLISEVLRNRNIPGTEKLSLNEMLTPKQIITTNDTATVTFEIPVSYEALAELNKAPDVRTRASIELLVDVDPDKSSYGAGMEEVQRATNGNCLLLWNSIYSPPGQRALQVSFSMSVGRQERLNFRGPVVPYFSSNLFYLDPFFSRYTTRLMLYAWLAEPNGIYTIEIQTPDGGHIKTIKGTTSDGLIEDYWDLIDDHGKRCTNESFNTVFEITLPDSGRSQTLR